MQQQYSTLQVGRRRAYIALGQAGDCGVGEEERLRVVRSCSASDSCDLLSLLDFCGERH